MAFHNSNPFMKINFVTMAFHNSNPLMKINLVTMTFYDINPFLKMNSFMMGPQKIIINYSIRITNIFCGTPTYFKNKCGSSLKY